VLVVNEAETGATVKSTMQKTANLSLAKAVELQAQLSPAGWKMLYADSYLFQALMRRALRWNQSTCLWRIVVSSIALIPILPVSALVGTS
jgi:hypothetical protein